LPRFRALNFHFSSRRLVSFPAPPGVGEIHVSSLPRLAPWSDPSFAVAFQRRFFRLSHTLRASYTELRANRNVYFFSPLSWPPLLFHDRSHQRIHVYFPFLFDHSGKKPSRTAAPSPPLKAFLPPFRASFCTQPFSFSYAAISQGRLLDL